jgi:hypothetical protein
MSLAGTEHHQISLRQVQVEDLVSLQPTVFGLIRLEQDGGEEGAVKVVVAVGGDVDQTVLPCLGLEAGLGSFGTDERFRPIYGGHGLGFLCGIVEMPCRRCIRVGKSQKGVCF